MSSASVRLCEDGLPTGGVVRRLVREHGHEHGEETINNATQRPAVAVAVPAPAEPLVMVATVGVVPHADEWRSQRDSRLQAVEWYRVRFPIRSEKHVHGSGAGTHLSFQKLARLQEGSVQRRLAAKALRSMSVDHIMSARFQI